MNLDVKHLQKHRSSCDTTGLTLIGLVMSKEKEVRLEIGKSVEKCWMDEVG